MSSFKPRPDCLYQIHNGLRYTVKRVKDGTLYELRRAGFPWTAFPADAPPRTWQTEAEWRAAVISDHPPVAVATNSVAAGTELRYLTHSKVRVDLRGDLVETARGKISWTAFPADAPRRTWKTVEDWHADIDNSANVSVSAPVAPVVDVSVSAPVAVEVAADVSVSAPVATVDVSVGAPVAAADAADVSVIAPVAVEVAADDSVSAPVATVDVSVGAPVVTEVPVDDSVSAPVVTEVAVDDSVAPVAADELVVKLAERIAREAHAGQMRRDGITPYIVHPADVAARLQTSEEKAVGWLHDTLEDTSMTSDTLLAQGVPVCVVEAVQALTRADGEAYLDFVKRLKPNALAARVKRADIASNLADAPTPAQIAKYASALALLDDTTTVPADVALSGIYKNAISRDGKVLQTEQRGLPVAAPIRAKISAEVATKGWSTFTNAMANTSEPVEPVSAPVSVATKGWSTFTNAMANTSELVSAPVSVRDDIAAARLQCEKWWDDWRDCGDFPSDDKKPAELCDLGEWPPADADSSRRLFATVLYEIAERYEDAAKTFIAAAESDKTVMSAGITESYDSMCRRAHGLSILEIISASDAVSKLASALRKGHEAFSEFVASHKATREATLAEVTLAEVTLAEVTLADATLATHGATLATHGATLATHGATLDVVPHMTEIVPSTPVSAHAEIAAARVQIQKCLENSSEDDAVSKLANALRKGHNAFSELVASHTASTTMATTDAILAEATLADATLATHEAKMATHEATMDTATTTDPAPVAAPVVENQYRHERKRRIEEYKKMQTERIAKINAENAQRIEEAKRHRPVTRSMKVARV